MEVETRQAALCIIRRGNSFLVAEIEDLQTGVILHRPPGGGLEEGESPEQAVRRELQEELGISLNGIQPLGDIDHVWFWKGREVRERAWLFLANASDDARLSRGELPDLLEANGQRIKTFWRSIHDITEMLPPLCPSNLAQLLGSLPIDPPD
jgi:8-oxo-dGTP pyrophosphatase MutT (NUDIX family)